MSGVQFSFYPTDGRGMNGYDLGGSGVHRLRPDELAGGAAIAAFQPVPAGDWRDQASDAWGRFKSVIARHADVYRSSSALSPGEPVHLTVRERPDGGSAVVCRQGGLIGCHPGIGPAVASLGPDGTVLQAKYMFRGTDLGRAADAAIEKLAELFPELAQAAGHAMR